MEKIVTGETVLFDKRDADLAALPLSVHRPSRGGGPYVKCHVAVDGKHHIYYLHRLILGVTDPRVHVDHINGNGLDNRRCNLRTATPAQNQANSGSKRGSHSKYKGVWYDKAKRRWRMDIERTIDGKRERRRGSFGKDEEAAARAYDAVAKEWFGEFAYLNFPES